MEVTFSIAFIVMLGMAYGRIKQKKPELMRSLVKAAWKPRKHSAVIETVANGENDGKV